MAMPKKRKRSIKDRLNSSYMKFKDKSDKARAAKSSGGGGCAGGCGCGK